MVHVTYVGNFLSAHGINPTYAEALAPRLASDRIKVRTASDRLHAASRLLDTIRAVLATPRRGSCLIIDLCSGPRAFPAALLTCGLAHLRRRPYILALHGGDLPTRLRTSRAQLLYMIRHAHRVVSPSAYLAHAFAGYATVEVIPNAIVVSDYPFAARAQPRPHFLYLRAFHPVYDPETALRAFAQVRAHHPEARMTMAGPDVTGLQAQCQELAASLGLSACVSFPGRLPKTAIPALDQEHDILVNSSLRDNTPVSTIEAMTMGMAIVATTVGGLPYLLRDGETALLVPPGDAESMAEAMRRLLEEPGLARRLSENARAEAERMDWSTVLPRWRELVEMAAAQAA